jgi:putative PIG3 family NAD(P)H quinone oxidoreductase
MPGMKATMHAITVGDPPRRPLHWNEVAAPSPRTGEVLLRVRATAVNRADLLQRAGRYPPPPGATEILGLEAAGEVLDVGAGVSGWHPGDRACALLDGGGYAEQVAVDAGQLLPIPEQLGFEDAAALPEVSITAFLNIWIEAAAAPGETVLVHAGASGVGTAAVQLCRALGHPVIATASAGKLELVRRLGAEAALDREEGFLEPVRALTDGRGVDVILDPVGGSYFAANVEALAYRGRLVLIGLLGGVEAPVPLARVLRQRLRIIGSVLRSRSRGEKRAIVEEVRRRAWPLVERGEVRPVIDTVLPITEAEQAHDLLRRNATAGKVVLTVA